MPVARLTEPRHCVPLAYLPEATTHGLRIGGPAPVAPPYDDGLQMHFATLEFDAGPALSIFYSLDRTGADAARDVVLHNNRLLLPSALIHGVWHDRADPGTRADAGLPGQVTCHRLARGDPRADDEPDGMGGFIAYPGTKRGGTPFVENVARVGGAFADAAKAGFVQLAQFGTPDPRRETFVLNFPWDPGWLHVLARERPDAPPELAFVIQQ